MRLCQTFICQTTPLWVGVGFPQKGMDVPTVNHLREGSVLGQKMRTLTNSPETKSGENILLCLHPGIGLVRILGQRAAQSCASDRH